MKKLYLFYIYKNKFKDCSLTSFYILNRLHSHYKLQHNLHRGFIDFIIVGLIAVGEVLVAASATTTIAVAVAVAIAKKINNSINCWINWFDCSRSSYIDKC